MVLGMEWFHTLDALTLDFKQQRVRCTKGKKTWEMEFTQLPWK